MKRLLLFFEFIEWNCVNGVSDGLNDFEHCRHELSHFVRIGVFELFGAFLIEGIEFSDDVSRVPEVAIAVGFEVELLVLVIKGCEFFGHLPVFRVKCPEVVGEVSADFAFAVFLYVGSEFGFKLFDNGGDDIGGFHELCELADSEFFVSICESEFEVFSCKHSILPMP